jgi:hypothetical protein
MPFEGEHEIHIFYQELTRMVRGDDASFFPKEEQAKLFEDEPDWRRFTASFNQAVQSYNAVWKKGEQFASFKFQTHMASLFNSHKGSASKHELVKNLDKEFHCIQKVMTAPEAQIVAALPPTEFTRLYIKFISNIHI